MRGARLDVHDDRYFLCLGLPLAWATFPCFQIFIDVFGSGKQFKDPVGFIVTQALLDKQNCGGHDDGDNNDNDSHKNGCIANVNKTPKSTGACDNHRMKMCFYIANHL